MQAINTIKKIGVCSIGCLFAVSVMAQTNQDVRLKWKIATNEKLKYLTIMSEIDTSEVDMNFGKLFNAFSDSTQKGQAEVKGFFKKLNESFKNIDFVSTLMTKGNGIIDVEMTTRPKQHTNDTSTSKESTMPDLMNSMNNGVVLRGSVYDTGGIHSFWVKDNQKNLISILFELPTKPVKVGEIWKLDVNLIANDQNFICDSAYKINEVKLADIKKEGSETIAIIKYNIVEFVNGIFNAPGFSGSNGKQPTMMKLTHQAIAEFSVDKGRWISYDGIMTFQATGIMTANKKTKITLTKD